MLQTDASFTGWSAAFQGKLIEKTVISRKEMSHPRVGANSSKASPSDISQEPKIYFNSDTNGQHSGFDIFEKNSGKKESENDYTVKRSLGNINFKTDHDYSGVHTWITQKSG